MISGDLCSLLIHEAITWDGNKSWTGDKTGFLLKLKHQQLVISEDWTKLHLQVPYLRQASQVYKTWLLGLAKKIQRTDYIEYIPWPNYFPDLFCKLVLFTIPFSGYTFLYKFILRLGEVDDLFTICHLEKTWSWHEFIFSLVTSNYHFRATYC